MTNTSEKIISSFRKKHSDLNVMMIVDYDDEHYVLEAIKDKSAIDYSDPYYGINKHTGAITHFSPAGDLEKFNNALKNKMIYPVVDIDDEDSDELTHHGIRGQKWGVRRYQNLDGSLTYEGRKRLGYDDDKQLRKDIKKASKKKTYGEAVEAMSKNKSVQEAYTKHAAELSKLRKQADDAEKVFEKKLNELNSQKLDQRAWHKEYEKISNDYMEKMFPYHDKCKEFGEEVAGVYADMKIKVGKSYIKPSVSDLVSSAINKVSGHNQSSYEQDMLLNYYEEPRWRNSKFKDYHIVEAVESLIRKEHLGQYDNAKGLYSKKPKGEAREQLVRDILKEMGAEDNETNRSLVRESLDNDD